MNKFQTANSALTFAVIGACGVGMSKWISDNPTMDVMELFRSHAAILLLWIFIILLKVKFWIDDNRYFGEDAQEKRGVRIFAFALAAFSMIFFSLAGLQIETPNRSAELEIIGILVSTAWIAVHLIEIKFYGARTSTEVSSLLREKWVFVNALYCLLLAAFMGWFQPAIAPQSVIVATILLGVLMLDWLTSRQTS